MRAASLTARAGLAAWCSAYDRRATSTVALADRELLQLAPFPNDVATRRRLAQGPPRSSTTCERSTAMTRLAQRAASIVR